MSLLPKERLYKHKNPFSAMGIKYFRPFTIKFRRRVEKYYGILFTCLTVRAVNVEIAQSLSTNSCMIAIQRYLVRWRALKILSKYYVLIKVQSYVEPSRELLEARFGFKPCHG